VGSAPITALIKEETVAFDVGVKDSIFKLAAESLCKWFYFITHCVGNKLRF
jgi:hypothetical protein